MFKFLDPTDAWAVLHFWIRVFYFFWRLFYHLNCRDVFPERTPIMRGGTKGEVINEAVELSRQNLINEAKKSPIKMLLDSPDPHGMYLLLKEMKLSLDVFLLYSRCWRYDGYRKFLEKIPWP